MEAKPSKLLRSFAQGDLKNNHRELLEKKKSSFNLYNS